MLMLMLVCVCVVCATCGAWHGMADPRWKKPVGDRLGTAAYNTVYGGKKAYTGPTLSGCAYEAGKLTIEFNSTLLRGDTLEVRLYCTVDASSLSDDSVLRCLVWSSRLLC
eukprot:COSAG06_NODE_116_length_23262_cov_47.854034_13_plen_110_part_00